MKSTSITFLGLSFKIKTLFLISVRTRLTFLLISVLLSKQAFIFVFINCSNKGLHWILQLNMCQWYIYITKFKRSQECSRVLKHHFLYLWSVQMLSCRLLFLVLYQAIFGCWSQQVPGINSTCMLVHCFQEKQSLLTCRWDTFSPVASVASNIPKLGILQLNMQIIARRKYNRKAD